MSPFDAVADRAREKAVLRFVEKILFSRHGCWTWTGTQTPNGYGTVKMLGRNLMAHRSAFELWVGPIAEGLHLDHLCRNRLCVRPSHLEPVTPRENSMRGVGVGAVNAGKTHCPRGHPYDAENTIRPPSGGRHCRACRSERKWERRDAAGVKARSDRGTHRRRAA